MLFCTLQLGIMACTISTPAAELNALSAIVALRFFRFAHKQFKRKTNKYNCYHYCTGRY